MSFACLARASQVASGINPPAFALRASAWHPPVQRDAHPAIALATADGGADRDRTDDLLLAKQALSQLSYGPDLVPVLPKQPPRNHERAGGSINLPHPEWSMASKN